jgi:hypothetical protein
MLRRILSCTTFILALTMSNYALADPELTLKQAVAKVQRESGGKILSARTMKTAQGDAYRIKVLTPQGRVRVVQIPKNVTKDQ